MGFCATLIAKKRYCFSEFKRAPSIVNYNNYKAVSKEIKKELLRIKKQKFEAFCTSLNFSMNISHIWQYIRAFQVKNCIRERQSVESTDKRREAVLTAFDKAVPLNPPDWDFATSLLSSATPFTDPVSSSFHCLRFPAKEIFTQAFL